MYSKLGVGTFSKALVVWVYRAGVVRDFSVQEVSRYTAGQLAVLVLVTKPNRAYPLLIRVLGTPCNLSVGTK